MAIFIYQPSSDMPDHRWDGLFQKIRPLKSYHVGWYAIIQRNQVETMAAKIESIIDKKFNRHTRAARCRASVAIHMIMFYALNMPTMLQDGDTLPDDDKFGNAQHTIRITNDPWMISYYTDLRRLGV